MNARMPLFAFFGTPRFAVQVLDALEAHHLLPALIVCAPDRPRGRGLTVTPAPTKQWALERDIDTLTPATLSDTAFDLALHNSEWDVFLVAAYAKLIPKQILTIPKHGALNVHPSLLPKFRGPSPALSAILANEQTTGASIMLMDEKMDSGPIIAQCRIELDDDSWPPYGSVFEDLLATEGGNLLAETLPEWIKGTLTPEPQNESLATYTKKFTDADACINSKDSPQEQLRKIRAFDRNPRAYVFAETKAGKKIRLIITEADLEDGQVHLRRVIPEGKKEMSFEDFLRSGATVCV